MDNELSTKFYGVLDHFKELIKFRSFKWLNRVLTLVTSSTRMNIHDMLILAYMWTFWNFYWCHFVLWWKMILLNKSCIDLSSPLMIKSTQTFCAFWPSYINSSQIFCLRKIRVKIYSNLSFIIIKPILQNYYKSIFQASSFEWEEV